MSSPLTAVPWSALLLFGGSLASSCHSFGDESASGSTGSGGSGAPPFAGTDGGGADQGGAPGSAPTGGTSVGTGTAGGADGGSGGDNMGGRHDDAAAGASGGAGENQGAAGEPNNEQNEPVLQPSCKLYDAVAANAPVGLGLTLTALGTGMTLYTWDGPTSTALFRYTATLVPSAWTSWGCFDLVPQVTHVSGLNLPNGRGEVLTASSIGKLFVRTEFPARWSEWLPLSLPARDTDIGDLAAVGGPVPRIYLVDRGQVWFRSKVSLESYSGYGAWRALRANEARTMTAAQLLDGVQLVFTVDSAGNVAMAEQPAGDEFTDWAPLPALSGNIVDLVATVPNDGSPTLHALSANGTLWSLPSLARQDWSSTTAGALGAKVVAIVSRAHEGSVQLFGVDAGGSTYQLLGGAWSWMSGP